MSEDWFKFAHCLGRNTNDFYPEMGTKGAKQQVRDMKMVCRRCPVILDCLEYAIDTNEQFGIWGGMTPKERNSLRRYREASVREPVVKVVKVNDTYEV